MIRAPEGGQGTAVLMAIAGALLLPALCVVAFVPESEPTKSTRMVIAAVGGIVAGALALLVSVMRDRRRQG